MTVEAEKTKLGGYLLDKVNRLTRENVERTIEAYISFARHLADGKPAYVYLGGILTEVSVILNVHSWYGKDARDSLRDVLANNYYGIDPEETFPQVDKILRPIFFGNKTLREITYENVKFAEPLIPRDHDELESFGGKPLDAE